MVLSALTLLSACTPSAPITPKTLAADEQACYDFVTGKMLQNGGMMTNYHPKPRNAELATGNEVLSESQGLLLGYTAAIGDRAVFDAVYQFTREHLDNGKIFVYRYNPDTAADQVYSVNATVDDLRIIKALLDAGEIFSDRALTQAAKGYTHRFYKSNVQNGALYDFYDTALYMKNNFITLCYLDLEAIAALATIDGRYQTVYDNALVTLQGGYLGDDFPLFATRYDYTKGRYETPNNINMVESLLTALNLAYADSCPEATVAFLKDKLEKGRIYASYKEDGTPAVNYESTAVYGLCALLAVEIGDQQMHHRSLELMKKFMVTKKSSPLYGAFGDEQNVYSFDNLMALTALRKGVG